MSMPRRAVMRHMRAGQNLALCVGRAGQVVGPDAWDVAFVSGNIVDHNLFRRGGNCLFPLYVYPADGGDCVATGRAANLAPGFIEAAGEALGLRFVTDGGGDLTATFGPEDIFHYIHAVLYSPEYRRRYADFLKSDFPHIPLSRDRESFAALAGLGRRLAALHLMEEDASAPPAFPRAGSNTVEKLRYAEPGCVWINADQYFEGVSPEAWRFAIGGYRPAQRWLLDRKDRALSFDDIARYRRLCAALAETPRIRARIDRTIDARGGWPIA